MGKYLAIAQRVPRQRESVECAKVAEKTPTGPELGLVEWCAPCGSPDCAGCYDVGGGRKIHPPKASREFLEWRAKWEANGRLQ